jgi:hypothetical protein
MTNNNKKSAQKAIKTAKWAKIMTKCWITLYTESKRKWELVSFEGPKGCESTGIVDMIAIRKDFKTTPKKPLKKGDPFEIILIQVKGGKSPDPSEEDISRLKKVGEDYKAKIILVKWKKMSEPTFYLLKNSKWEKTNLQNIFN